MGATWTYFVVLTPVAICFFAVVRARVRNLHTGGPLAVSRFPDRQSSHTLTSGFDSSALPSANAQGLTDIFRLLYPMSLWLAYFFLIILNDLMHNIQYEWFAWIVSALGLCALASSLVVT